MKKRTWDLKMKAEIVLEGLSGKPVSEICSQYQISQDQYYQWRDKLSAEAHRAFDGKMKGAEVSRLKAKNQRLQQIIGALTVELKKARTSCEAAGFAIGSGSERGGCGAGVKNERWDKNRRSVVTSSIFHRKEML